MSITVHPGQWRLEHLEVANWGTFSGLHSVAIPRKGFLLTGESGSGKSSLVDAISAVLTPRGKTRFNAAAADASTRANDRSVLTYVRGAWRRSADAETGEITSQYLRPKATWSGIALRYANGKGQTQTLIKLFHLKAGENTAADVKDVSILSPQPVSIAELEPFAANGLKVRELKAALPEANVDSDHSRFARRIARTLGLTGERATLLLHKTQSAKNLGSLDELFRKFMLDEPDTFAKADAAVEQFTELNAAHEAVLRARKQVEHLTPLRTHHEGYEQAASDSSRVDELLEHLDSYTHHRRRELTVQARDQAQLLTEKRVRELGSAEESLQAAVEHTASIRAQVEQRGGHQLSLLDTQLESARDALSRTVAEHDELERKLSTVHLQMPLDAEQFAELVRECAGMLSADNAERQKLDQALGEATSARLRVEAERDEVLRDMNALRSARSNLPYELLAARELICQDTGLSAGTLRFAGELLQVAPEYAPWTGAIERVLRPLALVMLVPSTHALTVSRAVNARHLNASLKFESISREVSTPRRASAANSLIHRVQVADSPMRPWLLSQLAKRFDYSCVESVEQLHEVTQGVTLAGQVKRGPNSFEKNDKFKVDDRRHWVLGFDTDTKLEQLQIDLKQFEAKFKSAVAKERTHKSELSLLDKRSFIAEDIGHRSWEQYDVQRPTRRIADLEANRAALLADDGDLRSAQHELDTCLAQEARLRGIAQLAQRAEATAQAELESLNNTLARIDEQSVEAVPAAIAASLRSEFEQVKQLRSTTHESIEADARRAQSALSKRKDALRTSMANLHQKMFQIISGFQQLWPEAAGDLTLNVEDREGYLQILNALEADRLPEFEDRFFDMLRTQTQQNIAQLRELIQRALRQIRQRIEPINTSLLRSAYSPGRFLQIRVEDARPALANEFLRDLNTVTTGALAPEEDRAESEARFEVLARIMTKLGSSEPAHRSWRLQVLDIRNHVRFTATEIDHDHQVMDVYDSGAGRSGGQKQKLVVFCLAAALRYQLAGDAKLPSYASIVMDEAFDKADSNFTKTAMDIFTEFGFHMILATPMKLLRTLEDYVGGVALVRCEDSKASHISEVPFEFPETADEPKREIELADPEPEPQTFFSLDGSGS